MTVIYEHTDPMQNLAAVSYLVHDYDEALQYFVESLGFDLVEDTLMDDSGKRFVRVRPPRLQSQGDDSEFAGSACLLLAKAKNANEKAAVGNQTGGRVFMFLHTDNFERDFQRYQAAGVEFTEEPRYEEYGTVVVFKDLYGNLWDLVQPATPL